MILDLKGIYKDYQHVNFSMEEGEYVAIMGPSGSGKTTLMNIIGCLDKPTKGTFLLNGEDIAKCTENEMSDLRLKTIGFVFQSFHLLPRQSALTNVELPLNYAKVPKKERRERALKALERVGLADRVNFKPNQLSGGQQQRCAMARILVGQPELVLLDEPFSALDEHIKWKIELELADTLRSFPGGVLFVSHSRDEIYRLCDTVCVLNEGKSDPKTTVAELFRAPLTVGAARISGCKNISRAEAGAGGTLYCADWGVSLKTALPLRENTAYAGIRAHYFTLSGTENPITCTVERVIPNPFSVVYMLKTPGGALLRMESEKAEALHTGDTITLHIAPEDVMPLTE